MKELIQKQIYQGALGGDNQKESIKYHDCDFSQAILAQYKFIDCEFHNCNFSLCKLSGVSFQDVKFIGCKLVGARFDQCSAFALSFNFEACILDHAVFHQLRIAKTSFSNCRMREVDFTGADLSSAKFTGCDVSLAVFENTNLEHCDLRGAEGIQLLPEKNKLRKAKFNLQQLPGLLGNYQLIIDP